MLGVIMSMMLLSAQESQPETPEAEAPAPSVSDQALCLVPQLPIPHANNAVASLVDKDGQSWIYSFMGLMNGKKHDDLSRMAYRLKVGSPGWEQLPDVPVAAGRLAPTAQVAGGKVYLFGGYSVAADGHEVSEPEVYAFDHGRRSWQRMADMPTPVDDSVSVTYFDRYIYLVSGWHNVGNVNFVWMFDTVENSWERVTDFPGKAVFGHAGGIVDNRFVIVDGVAVTGIEDGRKQFSVWPQGWMGTIDPLNPRALSWRRLPDLPGKPLYRMAGGGDVAQGRIIFAGGSETAYNYNGVGYDGTLAEPSAHVFAWNLSSDRWEVLPDKPLATMDHRALVRIGEGFYTVGGMQEGQTVTGEVNPALGAPDCDAAFGVEG